MNASKVIEYGKARKRELLFAREFAAVSVIMCLLMGVLNFISGSAGTAPQLSAALPLRGAVVAEAMLAGTDPVAHPELFDRYDRETRLDGVLKHLPGGLFAAAPVKKASPYSIVIDKTAHTLTLYKNGEVSKTYPCAVGKVKGDKQKVGDMRTPEGKFTVSNIHDARSWTHDFKDGKGVIAGAYGPWFIRLRTEPWKGIGIHGTHDPNSIGKDVTEGCIRLNNDDLQEVKKIATIGMSVTIISGE